VNLIKFLKLFISYLTEPTTWLQSFKAFVIMETFFRIAPRFHLPRIDFFTINGTYFFKPGRLASCFGALMFYSGAVFWNSLYQTLTKTSKRPGSLFYIKFGSSLFLFASLVVMPLAGVTNPQMRRGVVKKPGILGLGLNGWKTPLSNLVAHLIFAFTISRGKTQLMKKVGKSSSRLMKEKGLPKVTALLHLKGGKN